MSVILRDEKGRDRWGRPSYAYSRGTWQQAIAALTEDSRNILERLEGSQMLSCDVREDIRRIRIAVEKMVRPKRRKRK